MSQQDSGLPEGWVVKHSNTRNLPYYYNIADNRSSWEPPAGTDSQKLKIYMANYHTERQAQMAAPTIADRRENGGDKIRCRHLLVKHEGSRNPRSWRQGQITRTKDEARKIIEEYEKQIRDSVNKSDDDPDKISLEKLAVTESDCSSARKAGDLGNFGRGDMQKEFEDAAFNLQLGELSGVVETASGLHLIQRVAI